MNCTHSWSNLRFKIEYDLNCHYNYYNKIVCSYCLSRIRKLIFGIYWFHFFCLSYKDSQTCNEKLVKCHHSVIRLGVRRWNVILVSCTEICFLSKKQTYSQSPIVDLRWVFLIYYLSFFLSYSNKKSDSTYRMIINKTIQFKSTQKYK